MERRNVFKAQNVVMQAWLPKPRDQGWTQVAPWVWKNIVLGHSCCTISKCPVDLCLCYRIERFWRELWCGCTSLYYNLFYWLENNELLDVDNEIHLQALHFVYLPRLQNALDHFVSAVQNRPLRTEHNKSPMQLWISGQITDSAWWNESEVYITNAPVNIRPQLRRPGRGQEIIQSTDF